MVDCEAHGERHQPGRKKISIFIIISVIVATLILIIIIARAPSTRTKTPEVNEVKKIFIANCAKFGGYDCQKVWDAFEQAYVGRDECDVPMEAYDPFIAAAPFRHDSSKTLLWSKTRNVVDKFNEDKFLVTLGDTLFGNVTEGYDTWCGKKGSKETFTTGCPAWTDCDNSPVRSYWSRVSAAFAKEAKDIVTALLNGSIETPFDPESILAKIEVPALQPGRVTRLNVVLLTQKISKSTCASLGELRRALNAKIECGCKEVLESQNSDNSSIPEKPCGSRALQGKGSIVILAFLFLIITSL